MSSKATLEDIIENVRKEMDGEFGVITPNSILIKARPDEIEEFMKKNGIYLPESASHTKIEYLKTICLHYYNEYFENDIIQKNYENVAKYISYKILYEKSFERYLRNLDFISKQDLIDVFSDYCADLGINVYSMKSLPECQFELYLTKRKPFLKTEAVFVRTGAEADGEDYNQILLNLKDAANIAVWTVFVTTPMYVFKTGFEKMVNDMLERDAWFYIVDPIRKRVFGITKGGKGENYDSDARDTFTEKLPRNPLRAPSKLGNISDYLFKENKSYNPKHFDEYEILSEAEHNMIVSRVYDEKKYEEIFKNLIIIDKRSGLPIFTMIDPDRSDNILYSGFLTAMDDFVSKLEGSGDGTYLEEINYKGFIVMAAYGEKIKTALFLSDKADINLSERLSYFVNKLEERLADKFEQYRKSGDTSLFNRFELSQFAKEILSI